MKGELFENKTIENPTGEYENCGFINTTFKGRIDVELKNCHIENPIFDDCEIVRLETPGTNLIIPPQNVIKRTIQPIHWAKTIRYFTHNHKAVTALMKGYLQKLHARETEAVNKCVTLLKIPRDRNLEKRLTEIEEMITTSVRHIEEDESKSWNDHLMTEHKEVWFLAEAYFENALDTLRHAIVVREKRWKEF